MGTNALLSQSGKYTVGVTEGLLLRHDLFVGLGIKQVLEEVIVCQIVLPYNFIHMHVIILQNVLNQMFLFGGIALTQFQQDVIVRLGFRVDDIRNVLVEQRCISSSTIGRRRRRCNALDLFLHSRWERFVELGIWRFRIGGINSIPLNSIIAATATTTPPLLDDVFESFPSITTILKIKFAFVPLVDRRTGWRNDVTGEPVHIVADTPQTLGEWKAKGRDERFNVFIVDLS
mmetsp:Transcript_7831/g.12969  ORF Transcript_7831/g.12969 Transcript_7831/m.12969 type:complete len:231 (-) Transcript_7831:1136-1828(-)